MLPGIPGQRLVQAHCRPRAGHLVRRDRRSEPGAVDHDRGVGFTPCHRPGRGRSRIRIVNRIGRRGAEVVGRDAAGAKMTDDGTFERQRSVIAGDGDCSDVGARHESGRIRVHVLADHRDAAAVERVLRQRCDVPARDEDHCASRFQHASVRLGDHLEPLHDALCYSRAR